MSIWITTDWHLFRKPEGFTEYIKTRNYDKLMEKIHQLVSPDDILLVLGDLSHRDNDQVDLDLFGDDIRNLPGYHILVKGNHDTLHDYKYLAVGFDYICTCGVYDNLIFTHKPVPVGDDEINIHGHIHNEKFVSIDSRHIRIPPVEDSEDPPVLRLDDVLRLATIEKEDFVSETRELNPDKFACHKLSTSKDHLENVWDFHEIFDANPAELMVPIDEDAIHPACMPDLGHEYIHAAYLELLKHRYAGVLEEAAKDKIPWKNDKGQDVPKVCPKCGSKVGIFLRGEPVFLCSNKKCHKYFGTVPFSNESAVSLTEKRQLAKERNVPIFICLFHFSSVLSTVIAAVTKDEYTHSAISFDTSLTDMYSFGKFYPNNPVIGKFVHESLFGPTYNQVMKHAVYAVFVTPEEKEIIKARLDWFVANKGKMRYNYEGLLKSLFHIPEDDGVTKYAYLCSEFVASILKSTGRDFTETPANLVKPNDFAHYPWSYYLGSGIKRAYDRAAVDRRLAEIIEARNRGDEMYLETASEIMGETGFKSTVDSDHEQNRKRSLSSFKRVVLTEDLRKKYAKQYPGLSHFVGTDATNKSFIWLDRNGKIAAMLYVATFENDSDKRTWIEALEVTPDYKGYGLSKQLLDYATRTLHANALGVARDNELAQKIYLKYGFKFGNDVGKQDAAGKVNRLMYLGESARVKKSLKVDTKKTTNTNDPNSKEAVNLTFYNDNKKIGTASISGIDIDDGFLYNVEVDPNLRGRGYGTAIMDYIMEKYVVNILTVEKSNKIAISLYKKYGFIEDGMYNDNGRSLLVMRRGSSSLNENFIKNVPDLKYNMDEWKPDGKNFLWICGLSGGGKTTLANQMSAETGAEVIHLDDLAQAAFVGAMENPNFAARMSPTMSAYWKSTSNHIKMYKWGDQRLALETDQFVKWMIRTHAGDGKLYIIEGCEIMYMDADYLIHQPLIIKGTSAVQTTFWRFKRTYGQHREKGESALKAFEHCLIQFARIYKNGAMIAAENGLMRFKNILAAARKYNDAVAEAQNEDNQSIVAESISQESDLQKIVALNQRLNAMPYGISLNGRSVTQDFDDFSKYRHASPKQFERQGGGVCWDYVTYEADYFKRNFPTIPYTAWYVQFNNSEDCPSHTFLTFYYGGNVYYFESSFKRICGIYVAKKVEDIVRFVLKCMSDYPDPAIPAGELLKSWPYVIYTYDPLDPSLYGQPCEGFMARIFDKGVSKNITYASNFKVTKYEPSLVESAQIDRSPRLYHGSNKKLTILNPVVSTHGYPCVYATNDPAFAICYSGEQWNDFEINQCYHNGKLVLTEMQPGMFAKKFGCKGYLYELSPEDFEQIDRHELVCTHPVVPVRVDEINVREELSGRGVKLYGYPNLPPFIKSREEYFKQTAICLHAMTKDPAIFEEARRAAENCGIHLAQYATINIF